MQLSSQKILKLLFSDFCGELSPAMDIVAELFSYLMFPATTTSLHFHPLWSLAKLTPGPKILSKELPGSWPP